MCKKLKQNKLMHSKLHDPDATVHPGKEYWPLKVFVDRLKCDKIFGFLYNDYSYNLIVHVDFNQDVNTLLSTPPFRKYNFYYDEVIYFGNTKDGMITFLNYHLGKLLVYGIELESPKTLIIYCKNRYGYEIYDELDYNVKIKKVAIIDNEIATK